MSSFFKKTLKVSCLVSLNVCFAANAMANPFKVPKISKAEDSSTSSSAAPTLPTVFQGDYTTADFGICVTSICGPASGNWAADDVYLDRTNKPTPQYQQTWKNQFLPQALQNLQDLKQSKIDRASRLVRILDQGVRGTATPSIQNLGKFFKVNSLIISRLAQMLEGDDSFKYFSLKNFDKVFADQSDEVRIAIEMIVTQIYMPLFNDSLMQALTGQPPIILRFSLNYPKLSLRDAQIADATELLQKGQDIQTQAGPLMGAYLFDKHMEKLLTKAQTGQDLNYIESTRYVQNAKSIEMMTLIFSPAISLLLESVPFNFAEETQKLKDSGFAQSNLALMKAIDVNAQAQVLAKSCETRLAQSLDLNASPLRYRKLMDLTKDVKASAAEIAASLVADQQKDGVRQAINATQFMLPETNAQLLQRLSDALKIDSYTTKKDESLSLYNNGDADQFLLMTSLFSSNSSGDDDLVSNLELKSACEALPVQTISDYTLTSQGKISLSWFTANFPEVGVGIVAHEMGHVASHSIRQLKADQNQVFLNSLTCVAQRNPFVADGLRLKATDDTTWSEEDFADHFSSLVMGDLKIKKSMWYSERNMACSLVNDEGDVYADKTMAPGANDPHSSGFLRLLMVAQDRQQMTAECQKFLAPLSKAGRNLTCH